MCSAVVAATGAAREDRRLRVALKVGGVALREVALREGFGREGEDVGGGDAVLDDIVKGPALL